MTIKKMCMMLLAAMLCVSWSGPCLADDGAFKEIFKDSIYGGLTGALVGGAALIFAKKPADHLQYIGYGGAAGVMVGASYGLVKTTKSLAELDDKGKVRFALPTVIPDFKE